MKIVYIINSLRKAGPVIVLKRLLDGLDKYKPEIHIIKLADDEKERSMTSEFRKMDLMIHEFHLSKLQLEINTNNIAARIDSLLESIKPDLIHTHGYHPVLLASRLNYNCPKIETLHNVCGEDFVFSKGKILGRYMVKRYLKSLNKLSGAVAISGCVRDYYTKSSKLKKIDTVYNCIEPYNISSKETLLNKLGLNSSFKYCIAVGSLSGRKDPITVIRAFSRFKQSHPDENIQLLFLGKGELYDECQKEIGDRDDIKLLGWKPNPLDYMAVSEFSICASHSEGFGLNLVESLSMGCPVLCTNITVFDELTKEFKEIKKYQFNPGDVNGLANSIANIVKERPDFENVTIRACDLFSQERMADNYMRIYKSYC